MLSIGPNEVWYCCHVNHSAHTQSAPVAAIEQSRIYVRVGAEHISNPFQFYI